MLQSGLYLVTFVCIRVAGRLKCLNTFTRIRLPPGGGPDTHHTCQGVVNRFLCEPNCHPVEVSRHIHSHLIATRCWLRQSSCIPKCSESILCVGPSTTRLKRLYTRTRIRLSPGVGSDTPRTPGCSESELARARSSLHGMCNSVDRPPCILERGRMRSHNCPVDPGPPTTEECRHSVACSALPRLHARRATRRPRRASV